MTTTDLRCRLCGVELRVGLVATGRRHCCLNATPIVGACPEHGPLGPHDAVEGAAEASEVTPEETDDVTPEAGRSPD